MNSLEAIVLGIIQGLTEFLPVSSSGHLELTKAILGDTSLPEESLTFTVVLHFATALSTLVIFRKEVAQIIKGLFQFKWNDEFIFSVKIILSMIPAVVIGLLFEEELEAFFGGNSTISKAVDIDYASFHQVEYAAKVNGGGSASAVDAFIEFLLSNEINTNMPL